MKEKIQLDRGLTLQEVNDRIEKGLINGEFEIKTKSLKRIAADNIFTLFNLINTILVSCIILVHSYKNMMFYGVVIWNALIGIVQELRAKRIVDRLSILSAPKVKVLRERQEEIIQTKDIVMDDLLILGGGNQICADCIIVEGECEVNESLITGESIPVFKQWGDEILSGSFVISGNVKASVFHLGKDNYANKITQGAKYLKKPNSEIMRSVKQIIKVISIVLIPIALLLCYRQLFMVGQEFDQSLVNVVAAISGMIPGGLVLLTSIVLAVGVIRLAAHNTLAQDLYCIETLARVDVLCLDKTGTITEGSMQLEELVPVNGVDETELEKAVCMYTSALSEDNPTYCAIKEKFNQAAQCHPIVTVPFSSQNKWSLVSFEEEGTYILGAPEFILKEDAGNISEIVEQYTSEGCRVLLFACSKQQPKERKLPQEIKPLGLIVLSDKIRENVKETMDFFEKQGVSIKVISGDNPLTVSHVARKAGIRGAQSYIDALTLKTEESVYAAASLYTVFGRVSPQQKLQLIKALKNEGHTVAMTGDGVNDVLALKEADCSIAMQNGSDAARNTSQLVLMNSDFSSMPAIVAEGKRSINNLQRSAALYLVKTIYAALLALLFVFVSIPYPFVPIQITLIGSLSIGIPSFFLALEKNDKRIKEHFIRNVMKLAVPGGLLVATNIIITLAAAYAFNASTEQVAALSTISAVIASVIVLIHLCLPMTALRSLLLLCILAGFITALTVFGEVFNIVRLSLKLFLIVAVMGAVSLVLHQIYLKGTILLMKHIQKKSYN